jgi:hypothetical protein
LNRTLPISPPIRIVSAGADLANGTADPQRRYLLYPGGAPPHITIELESPGGRKRRISVDPIDGTLRSELETTAAQ